MCSLCWDCLLFSFSVCCGDVEHIYWTNGFFLIHLSHFTVRGFRLLLKEALGMVFVFVDNDICFYLLFFMGGQYRWSSEDVHSSLTYAGKWDKHKFYLGLKMYSTDESDAKPSICHENLVDKLALPSKAIVILIRSSGRLQ